MPTSPEALIGLAILIATPFAFVFYIKLMDRVRREGGKVRTDWVSDPDIVVALTVGGALTGLALNGFLQTKAPPELRPDQVIPGMVFLLVLAGGVAGFMAMRRLPIFELFGLNKLSVPWAVTRGFAMLLAAVPIVAVFQIISVVLLRGQAQEQELVTLFSNVARTGDVGTLAKILIAGVIFAPICEELLFRGYFYPVAKRYFGPAAGALLASALFAASHVNLASLPGLLVLALCFTAAFERTGSLLVSMSMHAFFNGANLLLLYLRARDVV